MPYFESLPLEFAEEIDQEVFSPDTRVVVPDTKLIPFRFICHIAIGFESADKKTKASDSCSGTLIGRRHVLTCAHAFDAATLNGIVFKPVSVKVTPGRNGSLPRKDQWEPFGSVTVPISAVKVHPDWPKTGQRPNDYALITLNTDIGTKKFKSLGNKILGCWGATGGTSLTPLDPKSLEKSTVQMGGYPGDKCGADDLASVTNCDKDKKGSAQFRSHDVVIDPHPANEPGMIYHQADMKKGQSGAPLWRWEPKTGKRFLVGVQSSEASVVSADGTRTLVWNAAVLHTAALMQTLKNWGWKP